MLTSADFVKKQIIFVFACDGEKISLFNGNLTVKNAAGEIKLQCSCYRLWAVYVIGHTSITTPLIQQSVKFGFFFLLFTQSFRFYGVVGAQKDGNTLLKMKQYAYNGLDLGKRITANKIYTQRLNLTELRYRNDSVNDAVIKLREYEAMVANADNIHTIMAYEGLASKLYFSNFFNNMPWNGRQPRIKLDWINSALDVGYTILFSFMESLLCIYGFDTYCGILHRQFYMRKSLVCDFVEPFRCIIDRELRKAYNLKMISEKDFTVVNKQYRLKWESSPQYISIFMRAVLAEKESIFLYVQQYYRCFMKGCNPELFPFYKRGE